MKAQIRPSFFHFLGAIKSNDLHFFIEMKEI